MEYVFISYSSKDFALAEKICGHLEKNEVGCWMAPRDIAAGMDYTAAIPDAIARCGAFLLVMTRNTQSSHWVHNELIDALSKGKRIIPFIAEDVRLAENYEFLLRAAHWEDGSKNQTEALNRVVASMKEVTDAGMEKVRPICPRCRSVQIEERPVWIGSVRQIKDRMRVLVIIAVVLSLWLGTRLNGMDGGIIVVILVLAFLLAMAALIAGIMLWLLIRYLCTLMLRKAGRRYGRLKCTTCGKKFRKILLLESE